MDIRKVLILPSISTTKDVWCECNFVECYQIAKSLPEIYFYVAVYEGAAIPLEFHLPNLHYVLLKSWYPYVQSQCMISSELYGLFNPVTGRYQVDVILTSKVQSAPYLKRMFQVSESVHIPVFALEVWANHEVSDLDNKLKAMAYSECPTFYFLPREKEIALGHVKKYFTSIEVAKARELGIIQPTGIPAKAVQLVAQTVEKYPRFTFSFAARFNSQKNWQKCLSAMLEACKISNGEVKAITPNDMGELPKEFSKVELLSPMPYDKYIEFLCRSHASVCASVNEGYTFGWCEQICTGNPILFPHKDWVYSLLGNDYPYIYKNDVELKAMLIYVQRKYEESRGRIKEFVEKFVEKNDVGNCSRNLLSYMDSSVKNSYMEYDSWDSNWKTVLKEMNPTFNFLTFIDVAAKKYKASFGSVIMLISSYRNIYRWLVANCEVVHCPEMTFRKV